MCAPEYVPPRGRGGSESRSFSGELYLCEHGVTACAVRGGGCDFDVV